MLQQTALGWTLLSAGLVTFLVVRPGDFPRWVFGLRLFGVIVRDVRRESAFSISRLVGHVDVATARGAG